LCKFRGSLHEKFCTKYTDEQKNIEDAFFEKFKVQLNEEDINSSHQIVVVASELDSSTERIIEYLADKDIPINIVFFQTFQDGKNRYLSRAWFIDPAEIQERATSFEKTRPWNGEFDVSFGVGEGRSWDDALKYGFICGGGGRWYSINKGSNLE
jgi:hypothetical protein